MGRGDHFSHDVSERLVTRYESTVAEPMAPSGGSSGTEQPPLTPTRRMFTLTPLPPRRRSPDAAATRTDPTSTPFDSNVTDRGERAQLTRLATPVPESLGAQDQLAALQLRVAMAEATARLVAAEQAAALGRRTTAEHLLAARDLEDTLSSHSRSSRSRSRSPPSPPGDHSTAGIARLVRYLEERDTRREQAAADRDARREAQHADQLAALRGPPAAGCPPISFTPNKGFSDIKPFSGVRGQDLLPWLQLFRARANFLQTPPDAAARELCLKLTGDALQAYSQQFLPDASPTFEEVVAHLAKAFIKPYQGAARWNAYFRFKRPAGSSGKGVKQQLHSARQACLDDGIPVDDLSPSESLYYIYQLSLSPSQSAQFLASLSSNPLASDDYLRTLTPTGAADRRASVAGRTGSEPRTALFHLRVALVEAFLDHDNGDGGHGGGARAAVTTGSPDVPPDPIVRPDPAHSGPGGAGGPPPSPGPEISDLECKLRLARGERDRSSKPPPEYNGPNPSHEAANRAELTKRRQTGACYACLNGPVRLVPSGLPATWPRCNAQTTDGPDLVRLRRHPSQVLLTGPARARLPGTLPPPRTGGGGGSARRQGCTPVHVTAGPGRRKDRSLPWQAPVPPERLRQLQTSGGQLSPHLCPFALPRRSGFPRLPSCPRGGRRRGPPTGLPGPRRGGRRIAPGGLRRRGASGTRRRRSMTFARRMTRTASMPRSTPSPTPCGPSWPRWRAPPSSLLGCGLILRSSRGCPASFRRLRAFGT